MTDYHSGGLAISCSVQPSMTFQLLITKMMNYKNLSCFQIPDGVFIMLIDV